MKFLKVVSISFILSSLCINNVFASNTGIVQGGAVNVRADATADGAVIAMTDGDGTQVTLTGIKNDFYQVNLDGTTGYMSSQFVKVNEADGVIKSDGVNVRSTADLNAPILGTLTTGENVTAYGATGDWYQISYNGGTAYIHKDYIEGTFLSSLGAPIPDVSVNVDNISTYGVVVADGTSLNLRSDASDTASIVDTIPDGDAVDVGSANGGWTKVTYNGETGFVNSSYISIRTGVKPENVAPAASQADQASSESDKVIAYAKQFIGTPYVWGGTNLNSGVDCSGFTYAVYKHFGVNLNRVAVDQSRNGTRVDRSNLQPGDLVFFDTSGSNSGNINHVGMYIGGGQFIQASSGSAHSVTISDLTSGFYNNAYVTAARVIGQ